MHIDKEDKLTVINDKISEALNYAEELKMMLENNIVSEDQIEHLSFVRSDQIRILSVLNSIPYSLKCSIIQLFQLSVCLLIKYKRQSVLFFSQSI